VLSQVERGEKIEETVRNLTLATEKTPPNFSRYHRENIEWAWRELQQRR
jgi:hypothetical protein